MRRIDVGELTRRLAEIQIAQRELRVEAEDLIAVIANEAILRSEADDVIESIAVERIAARAAQQNRAPIIRAVAVPRAVQVFDIGDRVVIGTGDIAGQRGVIVRITARQVHVRTGNGLVVRRAPHNVQHEQP